MRQYQANTKKALEAILWLVDQQPGIDVYKVVKCLYFADLAHIKRYGRPIFGDRYQADTYGPRGDVAYGLLRRRPWEMMALDTNELPLVALSAYPYTVTATRPPDLEQLSASDIAMMREALAEHSDKAFNELVDETHRHPAYIAANGGMMSYEAMAEQVLGEVARDQIDAVEEQALTAIF